MSEYTPSLQIRAGSSTIAADFIARVDTTLTIESLVARFSEALGLQAVSHGCYAVCEGDRRHLFGEAGWSGPMALPQLLPVEIFPITGWDEKQYEVEIKLVAPLDGKDDRANLHAMAVLYLCRGIALLDARDDMDDAGPTQVEQFCLDRRQDGWCDLDIADALDRSVHAVKVHIQRAGRKQKA